MVKKAGVLRKLVIKKANSFLPMKEDSYPQRVTFSFKNLPEAKNWKNGEKYQLILEVEQISSTKDNSTFQVNKVGCDCGHKGGTNGN